MARMHSRDMRGKIISPHAMYNIWELFGGTHSSQMTGMFVQGMVFDPLSADA